MLPEIWLYNVSIYSKDSKKLAFKTNEIQIYLIIYDFFTFENIDKCSTLIFLSAAFLVVAFPFMLLLWLSRFVDTSVLLRQLKMNLKSPVTIAYNS